MAQEEKSVLVCAELFSGKYNEKRDLLLKMLQECGYKVPAPFATGGD